jgi:hypothetical protein
VIEAERIIALVLGELPEADADAVEEHLLGCAGCSAYADWLGALGDGVRALSRAGRIELVATVSLVGRLDADGLPMRRYHLRPGEIVPCSIADETYNLVQLDADLTGAGQVDSELRGPGGVLLQRLEDIPYDPSAGSVFVVARGDQIRALPSLLMTIRLFSGDRVLGEYRLDHHATSR